ncbi:hypothetical protein ACLBXM_14855 [Xanthobacteraceae bacterium A53D]
MSDARWRWVRESGRNASRQTSKHLKPPDFFFEERHRSHGLIYRKTFRPTTLTSEILAKISDNQLNLHTTRPTNHAPIKYSGLSPLISSYQLPATQRLIWPHP